VRLSACLLACVCLGGGWVGGVQVCVCGGGGGARVCACRRARVPKCMVQ